MNYLFRKEIFDLLIGHSLVLLVVMARARVQSCASWKEAETFWFAIRPAAAFSCTIYYVYIRITFDCRIHYFVRL